MVSAGRLLHSLFDNPSASKPIVLLPSISASDKVLLKERISRAGGKVVVLVHPFFDRRRARGRYLESLRKMMVQEKTPVVVIEEIDKAQRTAKEFEKWGAKGHVIIPTPSADPRPIVSLDRVDEHFSDLANLLHRAGAKTVLVGGMRSDRHLLFVDPYEDLQKEKALEAIHRAEKKWLGPRAPEKGKSVLYSCVGGLYGHLILHNAFNRVHYMPDLLRPEKPKYERS